MSAAPVFTAADEGPTGICPVPVRRRHGPSKANLEALAAGEQLKSRSADETHVTGRGRLHSPGAPSGDSLNNEPRRGSCDPNIALGRAHYRWRAPTDQRK